jgi:predicted deacylase
MLHIYIVILICGLCSTVDPNVDPYAECKLKKAQQLTTPISSLTIANVTCVAQPWSLWRNKRFVLGKSGKQKTTFMCNNNKIELDNDASQASHLFDYITLKRQKKCTQDQVQCAVKMYDHVLDLHSQGLCIKIGGINCRFITDKVKVTFDCGPLGNAVSSSAKYAAASFFLKYHDIPNLYRAFILCE